MKLLDELRGQEWWKRIRRDDQGHMRLPVDSIDDAVLDALWEARRRCEGDAVAGRVLNLTPPPVGVVGVIEHLGEQLALEEERAVDLRALSALAIELEALSDRCFDEGLYLLSSLPHMVPGGDPFAHADQVLAFLRRQLALLSAERDAAADARLALGLIDVVLVLAVAALAIEVQRRRLDADVGPPELAVVAPINRHAPPTPRSGASTGSYALWRVMAAA